MVRIVSNSRDCTYKLHIKEKSDIDSYDKDGLEIFSKTLNFNVEKYLSFYYTLKSTGKLKKDGSPYSNAKIISHDELDILLQEITLHIQSLYQQMITGDIRIYPTRSDNPNIDMHINPCRFCHYKAICNYDIFYNEDHQIELGGQNEER